MFYYELKKNKKTTKNEEIYINTAKVLKPAWC